MSARRRSSRVAPAPSTDPVLLPDFSPMETSYESAGALSSQACEMFSQPVQCSSSLHHGRHHLRSTCTVFSAARREFHSSVQAPSTINDAIGIVGSPIVTFHAVVHSRSEGVDGVQDRERRRGSAVTAAETGRRLPPPLHVPLHGATTPAPHTQQCLIMRQIGRVACV